MAATPRYLCRMGVVVADDVVRAATERGPLPLDGALVARLKKPVPSVFFSFGRCGLTMPDAPLTPAGDYCSAATKEERFAMATLVKALDPDWKLSLRMQWYHIDLSEAEGRVVSTPSDAGVVKMKGRPSEMKSSDKESYKLCSRIARRRTTADADTCDGHEDDSDQDPMERFLDDLERREQHAEQARMKRLGPYPDTPAGRAMAKKFGPVAASKKRTRGAVAAAAACDDAEDEEEKPAKMRATIAETEEEAIAAATDWGAKAVMRGTPSRSKRGRKREAAGALADSATKPPRRPRHQNTPLATPPLELKRCEAKGFATLLKLPQDPSVSCSDDEETKEDEEDEEDKLPDCDYGDCPADD